MATSTKSLSARYVAVRYGITQRTARLFMCKIRESMASGGTNPMDGNVQVEEFAVGGREESKVGISYDLLSSLLVTVFLVLIYFDWVLL